MPSQSRDPHPAWHRGSVVQPEVALQSINPEARNNQGLSSPKTLPRTFSVCYGLFPLGPMPDIWGEEGTQMGLGYSRRGPMKTSPLKICCSIGLFYFKIFNKNIRKIQIKYGKISPMKPFLYCSFPRTENSLKSSVSAP